MNKLAGFYELKELQLPTVKWKKYEKNFEFDEKLLWTIRTAIFKGEDLNLPRAVGVSASDARKKADEISDIVGENGMVICYPYFIAEKSGTLNVYNDKLVIEAVPKDLWNLVSYSDREVTIIIDNENNIEVIGTKKFMSNEEIEEIKKYSKIIKKTYRKELIQGNNLLLEWSYAYNTDVFENKIGDRYLVFYEIRTT